MASAVGVVSEEESRRRVRRMEESMLVSVVGEIISFERLSAHFLFGHPFLVRNSNYGTFRKQVNQKLF